MGVVTSRWNIDNATYLDEGQPTTDHSASTSLFWGEEQGKFAGENAMFLEQDLFAAPDEGSALTATSVVVEARLILTVKTASALPAQQVFINISDPSADAPAWPGLTWDQPSALGGLWNGAADTIVGIQVWAGNLPTSTGEWVISDFIPQSNIGTAVQNAVDNLGGLLTLRGGIIGGAGGGTGLGGLITERVEIYNANELGATSVFPVLEVDYVPGASIGKHVGKRQHLVARATDTRFV